MKRPLPLKKPVFLLLPVFMLMLISFSGQASHLRAGEIYYKSDTTAARNPLRFFITLVTYSVAPAHYEDLEATLYFGDCTSQKVSRATRTIVANAQVGTIVNTYQFEHTYTVPGTYNLTYVGSGRNAAIVNLSNAVQHEFFLQSTLTVDPFLGPNRSPVLRTLPVDAAFRNQVFMHHSMAFDADGDSLSFKMVPSSTQAGENTCGTPTSMTASGFRGLENFLASPNPAQPAGYTLNRNTGQLIWNSPGSLGEFVVTMVLEEWRNGRLIGKVMRDRQLLVYEAPVVTGISEDVQSQVLLNPNPASAYLQLQVPAWLSVHKAVLYNTQGQPVAHLPLEPTQQGYTLPVKGVASGLYVIYLSTNRGRVMKKVLVNR